MLTDGRLRGLFYAFMIVTLAAMVVTMVAVLAITNASNERGKDNKKIIEGIRSTNQTILDCTRAPGKCYTEGSDRTAAAVTGINTSTFRTIVAGISCQDDGITEEKALAECIAKRAKGINIPE
jgi:ribose/xylose/arabinose/galactoside ABC-type transport system permease subunit